MRNRNLALIVTVLILLGGAGYFWGDQIGLKDGVETLVTRAKALIPEKKEDTETAEATATPVPEKESEEQNETEDSKETTDPADSAESEDSKEAENPDDSGNADDEEADSEENKTADPTVTQAPVKAEADFMPQAAAAGAGFIHRQVRHEKKVLTTAKNKAAQYDYDGAIKLLKNDNAYQYNVHFQNAAKKYKKEKDIAGKSKKRDACDAGPAAVFGDFADELGDRKGTPGAERYFCFRARFRSAKNAAVLSSVIPQALSPH